MRKFSEADEEAWRIAERRKIADYLALEIPDHGAITCEPFWSVAPYVGIWGVDSRSGDETIEFWVISGDVPTDYCSTKGVGDPRSAVRSFAAAWKDAVRDPGEDGTLGTTRLSFELRDLLATRAALLSEWADDASIWQHRPLAWWERWSIPILILGSLAGLFIQGSVFHLFGKPMGVGNPLAYLGFFGWIVLPFALLGYQVGGTKGLLVVASIFIVLFGGAYLKGVSSGAYG